MLIQQGEVIACEDGAIRVSCATHRSCSRCAGGTGCGAAWLARLGPRANGELLLSSTTSLAVGERVELQLTEDRLLWMAFVAYGVPLLLLLAGALIGSYFANEPGAIVGSAAGIGISGLLGRVWRVQVPVRIKPTR